MFLLQIFFPGKRTMFDHRIHERARPMIFFIMTFSAIIFLLYADSLICRNSLRSSANIVVLKQFQWQRHIIRTVIRPTHSRETLNVMQEEKDEEDDYGNQKPLVAPFNVTEAERIKWFRENQNEFKIFDSNNLSRQCHARILGFFSRECSAQFFMTWISPAKSFRGRELFSVESVFKSHPQACLVILSRSLDSRHGYRILKPLIDRGFKIQAVTPDLPFLFKGIPAEAWLSKLREGKQDPGEIPLSQNLSNLMRLVVLYRYGGIYLDTDFIVLKPLTGLRNSIGAQSMSAVSQEWTRLNNAVLIFDINHPLVFRFIEEFALTFDGNKWGYNGPYLVSRVVERVGKEQALNFTILPPISFYPVNWKRISGFFSKPKGGIESKWVEAKFSELSTQSYGLHLWNKRSNRLPIEEGSLMERICNYIYSS